MKLHDLLAVVIGEIDDGSGFPTHEAADLLVTYAREHPEIERQLLRKGAQKAVSECRPQREALVRAVTATIGAQHDFAELDERGFEHWISDHAALSEGEDAVRKRFRRMNFQEFNIVIRLRDRKTAEITRGTDVLRNFLRSHPEWAEQPELTLAEVLGLDEAT